ncbi:hypothetical protein BDR06DRAFT_1015473 [Suillus hirtellus]|nr:hypothetical protein BDR06DRAFT_1015473 [Suillus hirtellus]
MAAITFLTCIFQSPLSTDQSSATAPTTFRARGVVDIPESKTRSPAVEECASMPFPISDDPPQLFPTTVSTSDSPSIHSHPECSAIPAHVQGASVTFDATATTPSRAGSPEPRRVLATHSKT